MKICSVADIHVTESNRPANMPEADCLTVSGDLTMDGSLKQLEAAAKWLRSQPHKYKVIIAGNHDFGLENPKTREEAEALFKGDGITYLCDQEATIEGIRFYGSPWQPWFHDWAFNETRGPAIAKKWALIPTGIDVFLVHGPPAGYGDRVNSGEHVGCADMLAAIGEKKPRMVCFGHIHESSGCWYTYENSILMNCSVGYRCGYHDTAKRIPFVYEYDQGTIRWVSPEYAWCLPKTS